MSRRTLFFAFFVLFTLHFSACGQIKAVKDYFFGAEKKEMVTEKKKKVKKVAEKETAGETVPKKPPAEEKSREAANKTDAPSVEKSPQPPFDKGGQGGILEEAKGSSAPPAKPLQLTATEHFGGSPGSLASNGQMLAVSFGRRLVFYHPTLEEISSITLLAPIEKVVFQQGASANLVYVAEKGPLFEVVAVPSPGVPPKILKTFEVGGSFDVLPAENRLFVYLPDKVQILDVSDLNKVGVVAEVPLKGASQMVARGNYYYGVSGTNLTIVEADTLSVLATIPLGTAFKIVGIRKEADGLYLVLLLKSPQTGKWQKLQWMPIAEGSGGVVDPGKGVDLIAPVDEVVVDHDKPFLYFLRQGVFTIFDLSRRVEQPPPAVPVQNIRAVGGGGGVVFAVSDQVLGRFDASGENAKTISFPGEVTSLWLPGGDTALLVDDGVFYSRSFLSSSSSFSPLTFPKNQALKLTHGLSVKGAVLFFDETSGKIFFVKSDFSGVQESSLASQNIVGMGMSADGTKDYLYLAVAKKEGKGETALAAYHFQSPLMVKKMGSLPMPEIGGLGLYAGGTRAAVACGSLGVCLVDVGTQRNVPKMLAQVPSSQKEAKAVEVKVSPDQKTAYVFYEKGEGAFISLVDLQGEKPVELAIIPNGKISADQFRGLSFTNGGKILLVPDDEGLVVYDVGNPKNPVFSYRWPLGKAFFADVTNRGKTVCVALGPNGVECGSF